MESTQEIANFIVAHLEQRITQSSNIQPSPSYDKIFSGHTYNDYLKLKNVSASQALELNILIITDLLNRKRFHCLNLYLEQYQHSLAFISQISEDSEIIYDQSKVNKKFMLKTVSKFAFVKQNNSPQFKLDSHLLEQWDKYCLIQIEDLFTSLHSSSSFDKILALCTDEIFFQLQQKGRNNQKAILESILDYSLHMISTSAVQVQQMESFSHYLNQIMSFMLSNARGSSVQQLFKKIYHIDFGPHDSLVESLYKESIYPYLEKIQIEDKPQLTKTLLWQRYIAELGIYNTNNFLYDTSVKILNCCLKAFLSCEVSTQTLSRQELKKLPKLLLDNYKRHLIKTMDFLVKEIRDKPLSESLKQKNSKLYGQIYYQLFVIEWLECVDDIQNKFKNFHAKNLLSSRSEQQQILLKKLYEDNLPFFEKKLLNIELPQSAHSPRPSYRV